MINKRNKNVRIRSWKNMGNKTWKVLGVIGLYAVLAWNSPVTAKAAESEV